MEKWLDQIVGKLQAEGATSLADFTLERIFKGCVAGHELIKLAKKYRDNGVLTMDLLNGETK